MVRYPRFLSVATMTKYYKGTSDKKVFNNTLKSAFPDRFRDYTDFYSERYAQGRMVNTIHRDDDTYMDLMSDALLKAVQKRQEALGLQDGGITGCDGDNPTKTDKIKEQNLIETQEREPKTLSANKALR